MRSAPHTLFLSQCQCDIKKCVLWNTRKCDVWGVLFTLPGSSLSGKRKSLSEKNTTVQSRMRIANNSNFCSTSNRRAVPTELTRTNVLDSATGFPMTSKDRSSILFGHRLDNHILQVLRIVGFFAVLIVVQDEWVYFLLKSLSHVHHAVFSFLVLLQRNRVVDSVVPEHLRCSTWVPNFSRFEFSPTLLQKKEWSYNASSSYWIICSSVHPISGKYLRYLSSLCHLSKMVLYPPCLGWRAFCNTSLAVVHSLPFGSSMFGTTGEVLFHGATQNW